MAIKLVRKHVEEVVNSPIKLKENLFIKVRDLSDETDMTIEELVNFFIEEALKQVEFDDEEVTDVATTKTDEKVHTLTENSDLNVAIRGGMADITKTDYNTWFVNRVYEELGKERYNQTIRNRVFAGVKSKLGLKNVGEIAILFASKPEVVKAATNYYLLLAKDGNGKGGNVKAKNAYYSSLPENVKKPVTPVVNEKKVVVLPNIDNKMKMVSTLRYELKRRDKTRSFDACISESYNKMKKSYGINIDEEKKRYFKEFGIKSSGIMTVATYDDLWSVFWPLLQDNCGIDYNKIA